MRKLIIALAVMAFTGAGCSTDANKEAAHDESVPHEHADEAHDESVPHEHTDEKLEPSAQQEEFTVEGDSLTVKKTPEKHAHDGEAEHEH